MQGFSRRVSRRDERSIMSLGTTIFWISRIETRLPTAHCKQHGDPLDWLLLLLFHPAIAHRLMLTGVGFQLRPVQRYPAQFDCPTLQRHRQDLLEQALQRLNVDLRKSEIVRKSGSLPAASTLK